MFLRGIFSKASLNIMSTHTLEGLVSLDKLDYVPKIVLEYLYETVAVLDNKNYVAGVGNYVNKAVEFRKYERRKVMHEKLSHKEFNIVGTEEVKEPGIVPKGTIPDLVMTTELDLVGKPKVSWESRLRDSSNIAIDFRYELEDIIEQYNLARSYMLETYAIDIKRMLYLILQGRKETKEYLRGVLVRESDNNLLEVLLYLINFIEFEEYLSSNEEVLTLAR